MTYLVCSPTPDGINGWSEIVSSLVFSSMCYLDSLNRLMSNIIINLLMYTYQFYKRDRYYRTCPDTDHDS